MSFLHRQPKALPRDPNRSTPPVVTGTTNRPRANSHTTRQSVSTPRPEVSRRGSAHPGASATQMDPQTQQASTAQDSKPTSRSINITGPTQEAQNANTDAIVPGVKRVDSSLSKGDGVKNLDDAKKEIDRLHAQIKRMSQEGLQQATRQAQDHERIMIAQSEAEILRQSLRESQERAELADAKAQIYLHDVEKLSRDVETRRREANEAISSMAKESSEKSAADKLQIKQLLNRATQGKVEGKWNPLPDDVIRGRLNQLNTDMRDWAKNWALKGLSLEKGVSKDATKYLGDFVRLDPDGSLPPLIKKPPSKFKDKMAQVLLHAALAHSVHDAFFETPFFCTTVEQAEVLEQLFDAMKKADRAGAHIWRAGLWRLLNPPAPEDGSRIPPILETSRNNIKLHCESVGQAFRERGASMLMVPLAENSPDAQNRANKLRHILQTASQIATSLWTQQTFLDHLDLRVIHRKNIAFNVANPLLTGHPLSRVDVDNDKFNGRGIVLCARPALMAFDVDDTSGIEGDQYRVLAPAIVLLDGSF